MFTGEIFMNPSFIFCTRKNAKGINWGICFLYLVGTFYWDVWLYFSKITIRLSLQPSWVWFIRAIWEAVSWAISETHSSQFLAQWTFDNLTKAGDSPLWPQGKKYPPLARKPGDSSSRLRISVPLPREVWSLIWHSLLNLPLISFMFAPFPSLFGL